MQLNSACLRVEICLRVLQRARVLLGGLIWREPALPRCVVGCGGERIGHLHETDLDFRNCVVHACIISVRSPMPGYAQHVLACHLHGDIRDCIMHACIMSVRSPMPGCAQHILACTGPMASRYCRLSLIDVCIHWQIVLKCHFWHALDLTQRSTVLDLPLWLSGHQPAFRAFHVSHCMMVVLRTLRCLGNMLAMGTW